MGLNLAFLRVGGEVTNRYDSVLKGFGAVLQPSQLQSLQGDDIIDYIEPDGVCPLCSNGP